MEQQNELTQRAVYERRTKASIDQLDKPVLGRGTIIQLQAMKPELHILQEMEISICVIYVLRYGKPGSNAHND
jgi:hypothetical protein